MDVLIINGITNRATLYKPAELRREARYAVKGKGKLVDYFVRVQDGGPTGTTVALVATYRDSKGWDGQANVAI